MPRYRSAKVLIFDKDRQKVLVLRRSSTHPRDPFKPDLPGGMIEKGEDFRRGTVREIREETGMVVSADSLVKLHTKGHYFSIMKRQLFGWRLDEEDPDITISWEHDQVSWVPLEQLDNFEVPVQKQIDIVKRPKKRISKRLKRL